jgi:hypothetical protein
VKLSNLLITCVIAEALIKTDRLTARIMAYLFRIDHIPECYIPPGR